MEESYKLSAAEVQLRHHSLYCRYRNQNRIIQSGAFAEAWSQANVKERKTVLTICKSGPDVSEIKKWILSILKGGWEQYPISMLRQIGSYYRIKDYSRLTKLQLLDALDEKGIKNDSGDDSS